jgi:hypothetical protein
MRIRNPKLVKFGFGVEKIRIQDGTKFGPKTKRHI